MTFIFVHFIGFHMQQVSTCTKSSIGNRKCNLSQVRLLKDKISAVFKVHRKKRQNNTKGKIHMKF